MTYSYFRWKKKQPKKHEWQQMDGTMDNINEVDGWRKEQ